MKQDTIQTRLAVIEEKATAINERVEKIETNHLVHIYEKLEKIEKKQAYFAGGTVATITLLEIIIRLFK